MRVGDLRSPQARALAPMGLAPRVPLRSTSGEETFDDLQN